MKAARRAALSAATVSTLQSQGPNGFFSRLGAVPHMLRDTFNGSYSGLGKGRLAAMSLALLYLVSPVDLLPEALLTIPGLLDDAAVAVWLVAGLVSAADDYLGTSYIPQYATATIIEDPAYPRS